ncbi:MCE family protein [Nocardia harenae]|uniref:MCE family protein n=1 Tax=Nocardia harenae TaxID=358707 RepID=UPI0008370B6C|nr:MCE family protein [Nocardia harenae]
MRKILERGARTVRRPIEEHRKGRLGLVAVVVLLVVLASAVGYTRIGIGTTSYEAEFAQAAGIRTGDQVTLAGVPVGTVAATELTGDRVLVTFAVNSDVPLGNSTGAAIKLTTLLGARYVELRPAGDGVLADDRIPLERTEVPYDLQTALDNATVTFDRIDAGQIGDSLNTLAAQLQGVPSVLPAMLANIRALATIIGDRRGEMSALLAASRQLTGLMTDQQANLAAIMTQGRDLLTEIVARRDAVVRLMDATRRLADQVGTLVTQDRPAVDTLLAGLDGLLGSLARNDALLRNLLEILPIPIRNFANASGTANEVDFTAPAGPLIDSWMCALSGRAGQAGLAPYYQDCR